MSSIPIVLETSLKVLLKPEDQVYTNVGIEMEEQGVGSSRKCTLRAKLLLFLLGNLLTSCLILFENPVASVVRKSRGPSLKLNKESFSYIYINLPPKENSCISTLYNVQPFFESAKYN
jgi:hypothetical protein